MMVFEFIKLAVAAGMLFSAILVWNRTRDTKWVLMVCTAILWYAQIMLDFLASVAFIVALSPVVEMVVHSLPLITFSLALLKFRYDHDLS